MFANIDLGLRALRFTPRLSYHGLSARNMSKLQGQPEGLPDISRGLSVSDTPGTPSKPNRTLEGCQNCPLLEWHILRPRISGTLPGKIPIPFHNRSVELSQFVIVVFWHPPGVREIGLFRLPGVSSLRSSTPG